MFNNLVKCFKCPIEDCETLFETKEELDTHNKLHLEKNIFTGKIIKGAEMNATFNNKKIEFLAYFFVSGRLHT